MEDLVSNINYMLSSTQVSAVKVDNSHFKLVAKTSGIHITVGGANKGSFFTSFESQ
jgi:hypothetical protein